MNWWFPPFLLAQRAHASLHPGQTLNNARGLWVIVATVAPVLATVPLGMVVGNFLVWQVGPARKALNRKAATDSTLTYGASQSALIRVALFALAFALAATAIGTLGPW